MFNSIDIKESNVLMKQYETLPVHYKEILQLISIINEPAVQTTLFHTSQKANIRDEQGKRPGNIDFKNILARLFKEGFLELIKNKYSCRKSISEGLIWNAANEDKLERLAEAIGSQDEFSIADRYSGYVSSIYVNSRQCLREIRIGMHTHDYEKVKRFIGYLKENSADYFYSTNWWDKFFNSPFNRDHIEYVPLEIQALILNEADPRCIVNLEASQEISGFIDKLLKSDRLNVSPDTGCKHFFRHYKFMLILCGGHINEARKLEITDPKDANSLYLNAWLYFLDNKTEEAIKSYKAGLKIQRKEQGKENLHQLIHIFYTLMLIQRGDGKHVGTISTLVKKAHKSQTQFREAFTALEAYVFLKKNLQVMAEMQIKSTYDHLHNYISLLISALITAWFFPGKLKTLGAQLKKGLHLSYKNGYHWFALQFAELLKRLDNSESNEKLTAKLKESTGAFSLLDLVKQEAPWERSLNAIAEFCSKDKSAPDDDSTRLVWLLNITSHYTNISPKLQKRKPNGSWSSGRDVALKHLLDRAIPCMTDQDSRIAATLKNYSRAYYDFDISTAMPEMVGHPLVFNEHDPSISIEVIKKEPEIVVKQGESGFNINFSVPIDESNTYIRKISPRQVAVTEISNGQRKLADMFGPKGLKVPLKGKKRLQDILESLSSVVTVQSELVDSGSKIPMVAADARMHLRLLPFGNGVKLEILVRPFPGGDRYYKPGSSGSQLIAHFEGKSVQTKRDLEMERKNYGMLWEKSPTIADHDDGSGSVLLEETDVVLQALMELEEIKEEVVLQWPEGETFSLRKKVTAREVDVEVKKSQDWFSVNGELKVDDSLVLSLRKLMELSGASSSRFVDLGGGQFIALTKSFRRRLSELHAITRVQGNKLFLSSISALTMEQLWDELPVKGDKHWRNLTKKVRKSRDYIPKIPGTLQAELRDYQYMGFKWLSRLAYLEMGACLADDMGLGKTLQALAVILQRARKGPTLIVAPKSVTLNWISEAFRFAPTLKPVMLGGKDRKKITGAGDMGPFHMLVCSYGLMQQEAELLTSIHFTTIVLDEAQAIKNITAQRTKTAMALQGDFKLITTGTPIENHLGELWSLFNFINPGILGTMQHFKQFYANPIQKEDSGDAKRQLKRLLHPFILRRLKSGVLEELPEKTEILLSVEQSNEEVALYEALRREALEKLEDPEVTVEQKRFKVLAEIMRLRRACCHPGLVAPQLNLNSSKLKLLAELVTELRESNHKALIFSQFVGHLSFIREYMDREKIPYHYLDGSTPLKKREQSIQAFQAGEGEFFLISLKAGGFGLNLTAANYVIHMDPWWNPAVEDQASDRVHRIGQRQPVTIYRLVTRNTIEEKIIKLHKTKRNLADTLLAGTDHSATLSVDQLIDLMNTD